MDQETLVDAQIRDGLNLAIQFHHDGGMADAVFWARDSDSGKWHLYVVSGLVDTAGPIEAYGKLYDTLRKLPDSSLQQFRIKLVGRNDPAARDISSHEFFRQMLKRPPRFQALPDKMLGNMIVDEFYSYGPIAWPTTGTNSMPHEQVKKAVSDLLLECSGPRPKSTVNLQDGTSFRGVLFGVELVDDLTWVKFIEDAAPSPRAVPIYQIASIQ